MHSINPNTVISLRWKPAFDPILAELNQRVRDRKAKKKAVHYVARALLELLRDNDTSFTVKDVVNSVYSMDEPPLAWVSDDRTKWYNLMPSVVARLRSNHPRSVLDL